jgi:hypothetical protein
LYVYNFLKQPKKYGGFYHGKSVGAFYTQVFINVDKFQFGVLNLGLKFKIIVTQNWTNIHLVEQTQELDHGTSLLLKLGLN